MRTYPQKLSASDRELIRAQAQAGLTRAEIALNFDCSVSSIRFILQPDKLAEMRKKAVKNDEKNRARVKRCRERKKQAEWQTPVPSKPIEYPEASEWQHGIVIVEK